MKTILVADDEPRIVDLARDYLEHAGFAVITAADGPSALMMARTRTPDVMVLDLGLPGMDGLDVARALRRETSLPIVMLTARDDELDRVLGLEIGADDYVTKPFSPRELVARVRAILRRVDRQDEPGDRIEASGVSIDQARMRVEIEGRTVELTPTEFQLLTTLARQPGRVFTRLQLLDAIHGIAFESYERAIDAHVKNLRRKLEPDPTRPKYVLTVYGVTRRYGPRYGHRHGHRFGPSGRRPPWWPADEPWPPVGEFPWHKVRRRFFGKRSIFDKVQPQQLNHAAMRLRLIVVRDDLELLE